MINQEKVCIRPMQYEDCELVEQLEQKCFAVPWTLQSFKDTFCYDNYQFLTAWIEKEFVGYMGLIYSMDEADITNVAVFPKMRNQGVGQCLVKESLNKAMEQGIAKVFLEVRESNKNAISLYSKYGFQKVSVRKNYYQKPIENAVIMSVNLTTMKNE